MPEPYRAAIYYAPDRDDPLWQAGCAWLGRDPETDETLPQPGILAQLTTSPRQYGFHATLKPPIHLAHGLAAFLDDTQKLAATLQPFKMPRLEVKQLGAFIALCLSGPSPEFRSLADHCVTELDRHRIPEDQSTQAARAANRSPRQRGNIERFGYPLLFDDWHFHMTLTNPTEDPTLHDQAQTWFDPVLSHPRTCTAICIYQQPTRTAPFTLTHRIRLGA